MFCDWLFIQVLKLTVLISSSATGSHLIMLLVSTRRVRRHILRQVRLYSQEAKKFDILYMGRDEFSCGVFRELYAASGMSKNSRTQLPYLISH